ncbi:MAG TPA: hypothetical protein VHV08_11375, partial [Pirellulales bacterium]|nr:hypothetical protein [Pirellulales bacterium]
MLSSVGSRRVWAALVCATAALLCSTAAARAQIAPGQGVPSRIFLNTLALHYDGDYRSALNAFLSEASSSSIKTTTLQGTTLRWIDSICYLTMAGESYYELGQLPQALASYDAALKLYVAYSDWMLRVQFPSNIAPAQVGT